MLYYEFMENNSELTGESILSGMILSASGWRGVFAADGDEESFSPDISEARRVFCAAAALIFSEYLKGLDRSGDIIVGRDTRPTGTSIADAIIRVLAAEGWNVRWLDVSAAPEIMAYTGSLGLNNVKPYTEKNNAAGFIYISASHNPVGHNGLKFGLTDGGVLPGPETAGLISALKKLLAADDGIARLKGLAAAENSGAEKILAASALYKKEALDAYARFTREVVSGVSEPDDDSGAVSGGGIHGKAASGMAEKTFDCIRAGLAEYPLGICVDFNGSARTVSIDRSFLGALGAGFRSINDVPGTIVHRIVPEGESLVPCADFLAASFADDPSFILGYVPDCDGDRGNLVIWDSGAGQPRPLEAQEVFALSCVAELSFLVWSGRLEYDSGGNSLTRAALAVNDPTSLRIDRIARAFDIPVFRAEVGEANVVGLARKLREEGYLVRILGEGSNGGNITHPAAVRDPLNTISALVKILTIRTRGSRKGLFELWCDLSGQAEIYKKDFTLTDIIASLPAYQSTGVVSDDGLLKVTTTDHALLKERYQDIFLAEWNKQKELRAAHGITGWDATAYNGIEERPNIARFGEAGRGGLKIGLLNSEGRKIACLWMRGSGTEPIFRVMADAEGPDPRFERELIEWHRRMVMEADRG